MASALVRDHLIANIRNALERYRKSAAIPHDGLKGTVREIALDLLLRPIVPMGITLGRGLLTDRHGKLSRQTDVVVIDPGIMAPVMYDERTGIFPIDACLCAIEVKSTLTAAEIQDAIAKARAASELSFLPVVHNVGTPAHGGAGVRLEGQAIGVTQAVFAFSTDLSLEDGNKTELQRYAECDANGWTRPAVQLICVAGRGLWKYQDRWTFHPPSEDHDEVIDFLSIIVNSLMTISASRGWPRVGEYTIALRPYFVCQPDGSTTRIDVPTPPAGGPVSK